MALRNIVKDGDPILKKTCRPVTKFDGRLHQLLDDMGDTMMDADGVGLAASQVGIMRRAFVALLERPPAEGATQTDPATGEEVPAPTTWEKHEFVNPEIVEEEGDQYGYEGCLSFPGEFGAVHRPQRVVIKAQDRNGEWFTMEAEGLGARCLCHETNHLDGITMPDLAEYFYDPDEPHELDATLGGREDGGDEAAEDGEGEA